MKQTSNIQSISFLKANAAKIAGELAENQIPWIITQNGEASMVIESVERHAQKEELISLLKILALGEKDRAAGLGVKAEDFRQVLAQNLPSQTADAV